MALRWNACSVAAHAITDCATEGSSGGTADWDDTREFRRSGECGSDGLRSELSLCLRGAFRVAQSGAERVLIEIRRLEGLEYHKLNQIGDDDFIPDPEKSIAIIAENEQKVIGKVLLLAPAHIEGIFIEPAWRNGTVMNRLVAAVELEARAEGITKVMAYAKDTEMEHYIERLGYRRMPISVWAKGLL